MHEEVLTETMDQSESRVETCEPPISMGDETLAPAPPQDSTSIVEPVSSQGSEVLSNDIQPETSNVIVPEPTALKTQRNRLPKPNLSRASRTTQREPAELVTSSAETFSAPVASAKIAAKTAEPQISTVKDFVPEAPSQPEPEELNSEICEERENGKTEGCVPVLSLEKMMEDEVSGRRTRVEEERREEMQQTHRYIRKDLIF